LDDSEGSDDVRRYQVNKLHWPTKPGAKLYIEVANEFPRLTNEGEGVFAGWLRQALAAHKLPLLPLFPRTVHRRQLTLSKSESCIGLLSFFVTIFSPAMALAHTQGGEALGFVSGLAHPVSGLDHVLAMVAVGLWGAQLGAPAVWILPVTFPMVMALGGTLGLMGLQLPGIEICIALSAVALGVMVFREAQPNLLAAGFLVGFFAIFHGYAHGTELPPGANGMLYSIGFVIATGALHATGIAIGLLHRWRVGRFVLRAAGAMVSIGGAVFLWHAIA
jgi:urease accessory protein